MILLKLFAIFIAMGVYSYLWYGVASLPFGWAVACGGVLAGLTVMGFIAAGEA